MKPIEPLASAASTQARRAIDGARSRDAARLHGLWRRWQAQPADDKARDAFAAALAQSVAEREARASRLPRGEVDTGLPIASEAGRIVELIRKHPVVVIAGETGSGKTTQLPKLCLAAGRGAAGMIGCTQPRRIAARAVARRVAEELQVPLGGAVGYQVRFNDNVGADAAIKFMTDGILLAEIQSDRWLSAYDTIIVDEAHERSLNIDFLLGYLKQLLRKRSDLKIIVTSATIDTERFSAHFDGAPVVDVEGRGFPVEVRYRPLEGEGDEAGGRSVLDGIVAACDEISRDRSMGDTLVFLPGEREIRDAHQALERRKYRHTEVLPLYARLSVRDQDRVFNPGPQRRIVLATNVAETSLTVPRIHYVVDPGLARVKRYSPRQKLDRLHIEPISQASADQRKGRCGRIAPGTCFRIYSQADFESRPPYTDPEIRRAALAGVILRMLSLGLGRIEDFPFLEPPDPRAIADGWQQLQELGAVDAERKLTAIGRTMSRLPVDVKLARMLVAAQAHGCLPDMLAIASFLGIQDPRERPADQRAAADNAHALFADAKSEFVGILKLWEAYREAHEAMTQSQLRKWCEKHFLGFLRMREWRELHRQLKLQCEEIGWTDAAPKASDTNPPLKKGGRGDLRVAATTTKQPKQIAARFPALAHARALGQPQASGLQAAVLAPLNPPFSKGEEQRTANAYATLHRALLAGLPTQIGQRTERGQYDGPRSRKFLLFPGSPLAKKPPPWVLSATLLDTEKVWSLTNAAIEPEWAIDELAHLLARRRHDPRWSRSQGRVVGSEQISLFGLVLAPKRPIHYGALFPEESRAIFARDALVTGEINTRSAFLARNLKVLALARDEEAKQRRSGLVVDEDWMAQWYLDRLPPQVHNAQALDAWYAKLPAADKAALEWSRQDLLVGDESEAARFPPYFAVGDARLAVRYRFQPGEPDDGMTVVVPLHLLNALDAARLSWLAPGFVADKAAAMIKSLPKALRRNFVPAPDFARAFVEAHRTADADAFAGSLARFLRKLTGVEIAAVDFDEASLDPHLRMNLRLLDSDGRMILAESRDLDELRQHFGARATQAFAAQAARGFAQRGLTAFPAEPIPESVPGAAGVPAYPALDDEGDTASLGVHATREEAQRRHPRGVRRLLSLALADKLKQARKQLPVPPKAALLYAAIESAAPRPGGGSDGDWLRADLVDGAFAALAAEGLDGIRDAAAFQRRLDAIAKALFPEAVARLQQAETILGLVAEVRAKLDSKLIGWASGNLDDMRAHLASLTPPGFLRDVPAEALREYPRYLKALALRGERALRDPTRDQARMLEVKPFADAIEEAFVESGASPEWNAVRWELEELRVSLFAQELGARGGVSPKKMAQKIASLRDAT
ncbi:ATP-dependent RNA helicase HrpA [Luteimonas sp. SX5]|uniref:ATP-dependent RNA helicase HrpA n=1 Tax=Luteimonas galliterrae TaxID=2940486 RepID=A0ABT0MI02_9GAMM|nr:ATP-dependent RNA helicase HrpA [Luteimonas galliterrae]MCL1634503.1 ATP-dependent RNA helicase HrpA [Luteimonas galliterrae]